MTKQDAGKTILMVEPDVVIRMVVAEYLRECGYRVIEAVAAQDVWIVLESGRRVDIVLADVKLAGDAGGFALASRIRQTRSDIDVILTSGIAGAVQESSDLCSEGPIKKPYEPKDVEARIRVLLERRRTSNKL
ncbi:MAG TPA: response regulator [Steroidobacteraceae bacterium]|jgi:DNA-binding response OmpR family regulator|nr:response regulator [Steroidobacteraceae bacterium]